MLTYLINVTSDLMTVFLVIGVVFAFVDHFLSERGQLIARGGLAGGIIISAIRSYITNTRRIRGGWRIGAIGYAVSLVVMIVGIVVVALTIRQLLNRSEDSKEEGSKLDLIVSITMAIMIAAYMYNVLPAVLYYPFKFTSGDNGLLSTEFLMRLGGYLLGWIVCAIAAVSTNKVLYVVAQKGNSKFLVIVFMILNVILGVFNFAKLMLVLIPRRIVKSITLFTFAAKSNNHASYYTFAAFIVLVAVAIFMWMRSRTMQEPYANKAQHRKQRAVWRTGKRFSVSLILCFVMSILCATWFVDLNTVVIREAPVENPEIVQKDGKDDHLVVNLDLVADGHLHRFGYTTEDGIVSRFIVVLKQENTNNYGIGLDACEICGEAGYFENNDGQVVCKKCNVVMNKTTIGMKGGCNPIIIDYDIDSSKITVPVEEMVKNAYRFKD